ncbi:MAG: bifunctional folylpolyglutamate synthase/dihydrofolate synthase [Alphaproteobacteria bacterium]|nr:bifunctional folylpolyglutamate synthase/dihydrofolate synthase [Alphaproteobacteria bacterium]
MQDSLSAKLAHIYALRLHAPRSSLADRSDYRTLLTRLGNPQHQIPPVIHVAGTNGKGSTVAFLRAMYEAAGYKVHTYTSPHLVRFNERITISGQDISDALLETLLDEVMTRACDLQITFFEIATTLAFLAFSRNTADLCLIETGMGGRLDCTNIIERPLATLITRISYDHCQYLGSTLSEIAGEKAGIMKPGRPCIIGYQHGFQDATPSHDSETLPFESIAGQIDTPLHRAGQEWSVSQTESNPSHFQFRYGSLQKTYRVPQLVGAHQLENAGAALACTHVIDSFSIHDESRAEGLTRVNWAGRLQRLDHHPLRTLIPANAELWLDGGHNDSAGEVLARQAQLWHAHDPRPLHLIMAMKQDKKADQFLGHLLPHLASLSLLALPGLPDQSHDPEALTALALARRSDLPVTRHATLEDALRALGPDNGDSRILITGSLFLVAHVLAIS